MRIEGHIINIDGEFDGAIEIDEQTGLISSIGPMEGRSDIDTSGCLIFSGFGDLHVHAREDVSGAQNYKEDFLTMSQAAIAGGVTFVADMPNNPVAPIDNDKYVAKLKLTEKSLVDVVLYAGIGPTTSPLTSPVPYKAFMGPSVGNLFFSNQAELEQVISKYSGQNISFHCEDPEILESHKTAPTHEQQRPAAAESTAIDFALHLIEKYNLQGKICHYSVKDGLPKIQAAKKRGVKVTVEVTPHHLFFDTSHITEQNHKWLQMNPPLRSPEDRQVLIEALRAGDIDYLATDHAPHTPEEKQQGTSGVPHLDTYTNFVTWLMTEHQFTPQQIARIASYNPAQFVKPFLPTTHGLGFGRIAEGYVGSLTIVDMNSPVTVKKESIKSKCGWSPFENMQFSGLAKYTIVRGKLYNN